MVTSKNPGLLARWLRTRVPLAIAVATSSVSAALFASPLGFGGDEAHLRAAVEASTGGSIKRWVWSPSRGILADLFLGRAAFLEVRHEGTPGIPDAPEPNQDIWAAHFHIAPEGGLIGLRSLHNLTRTTKADERFLSRIGDAIAYGTVQNSAVFTVLRPSQAWPSLQTGLRGWLRTGKWGGYQTTYLSFLKAPQQLTWVPKDKGQLEITANAWPGAATVDLGSGHARGFWKDEVPPLLVDTFVEKDAPVLHFAADLGRACMGPGFVSAVEAWVLSLRDLTRRSVYRATHFGPHAPSREPKARGPVSDGAAGSLHEFPPPGAVSWGAPRTGWVPRGQSGLLSRVGTVHPDPERPYVTVELAAFDLRYLELGIRGGYREPEPETGPPDTGHIPADNRAARRVIATFNGGFQTTHGRFGMKSEGRWLVAPRPGLATVRIDRNRHVGFGTWARGDDESAPYAVRQNLGPLLVDGVFDPLGIRYFGDHLQATGVTTERSAVCATRGGHLVYAWSEEADPKALAEALRMADCRYGVHLDMNAGHSSLSYHRIASFTPFSAQSQLLTSAMQVNPERFLRWSPKDFFYVSLRSADPEQTQHVWTEEPMAASAANQVAPSLLKATSRKYGAPIELLRVETSSIRLVSVPGQGDRGNAEPFAVPGAVFEIPIGHKTQASRPGFSVDGRSFQSHHRGYATLLLETGKDAVLLPPGTERAPSAGASLVQFPVLARDGQALDLAGELGDHRLRGALCLDSRGELLLGRSDTDSYFTIVQTLLAEGCSLIVALDRGSHDPVLWKSAGLLEPDATASRLLLVPEEPRPLGYTFTSPSSRDAASSPPQATPTQSRRSSDP